MTRYTRQKPTRTYQDDDHLTDYRETHPAYGMIGVSRVSSTPGAYLFGSDFQHQHYMIIAIRRAEADRSTISTDYTFATEEIIEVALSEAQWATFVSSPNVGHGVECTIQRDAGYDGFLVPGIEPIDDRREQFRREVDDRQRDAVQALDDLLADDKLTKRQRAAIETARARLTDGLPWVAKMFDEHAEKTVEKAKMEVNAYITQALMRAGVQALGEGSPIGPLTLEQGEADADDMEIPDYGDDVPRMSGSVGI